MKFAVYAYGPSPDKDTRMRAATQDWPSGLVLLTKVAWARKIPNGAMIEAVAPPEVSADGKRGQAGGSRLERERNL
jgi:hypothetical protein